MKSKIMVVVAASIAAIPAAGAQQAYEDWQSVDRLTQMVASAIGQTAVPIDRRIKLARCPEQASVTVADPQSLAVRCASLGWRLRVPMSAPGGQPAAFGAAAAARPAAAAAPVVRRGDNVRVSIDTASFSVSYSAIANEDGQLGETIGLRGTDSKSIISAKVTGPGRASLAN